MKFYCLERDDLIYIEHLFKEHTDNTYYVLNEYNDVSDIVQYNAKYNNVHIVTVKSSKLDTTLKR